MLDLHAVLAAIKNALPPNRQSAALHEPLFSGNEWMYIKECLDTGWVSSVGKFVDRFENDLADYTGIRHAVAVVNGTSALHICLKVAGIEAGDEVLMPTLTFVATANAVTYCGATPHFVDSELSTLGLDPFKLSDYLDTISVVRHGGCYSKATGRRIKAVIPMHTFGHPVELDALADLCERYRLVMVEDAAESLGTFYKTKHTGNWGRISALSFNGNKIITTGGGGAILTNDAEMGRMAKHITTTARVPHPWELVHDSVGYNYRLPNLNAALGCAQLELLPSLLQRKRMLAERYRRSFADIHGVRFITEPDNAKSNYWLNAFMLDDQYADKRDAILELTNRSGIQTRPTWTLMHKLPMFSDCPRMDLSIAENISRRLVNIPSSAVLGDM